jgi:hypothetical protein
MVGAKVTAHGPPAKSYSRSSYGRPDQSHYRDAGSSAMMPFWRARMLAGRERRWPERVEVDWRRFSSGLWREPAGDIWAASDLEALPKARTFKHDGILYVPCGMSFSGSMRAEADCFRIIRPEEYRGPEPRPYSYEGRHVTVKGQPFRLGPKVVFKSREPTVAEWRHHLKILYPEGGVFATKPTYAEFLDSLSDSDSSNRIEAFARDRSEFGKCTKDELRLVLKPQPVKSLDQLSFKW